MQFNLINDEYLPAHEMCLRWEISSAQDENEIALPQSIFSLVNVQLYNPLSRHQVA